MQAKTFKKTHAHQKNGRKCPSCGSRKTKKFGTQLGRQRYRCNECGTSFQNKPQPSRSRRALLRTYVWRRQTLSELADATGLSIRSVQREIDAAEASTRQTVPTATCVAADMTFWGRGYGVIVFRSPTLNKNLWWKESLFETPFVYRDGLIALRKEGWTVTSAVIDGKRGVAQVFEHAEIPVQYCQFHQVKTVTKYLTRKPKTEAARALRALALTLSRSTEQEFKTALAAWQATYETFLFEKSVAPHTKRGWEYTHKRLRAAYRSLTSNLSRLFTYQRYPELNIPNTTNTLDGMFSQIKNRIAVHRGLNRERRYKIVSEILKGRAG
ncbi:MAG: IS256 family transposase, variant Zn-binding type [Minisyncoccota bacterium]